MSESTKPVTGKNWRRVVAKAWADEDYTRRLMKEPEAVLREEGITVPPGVTIRVVADTPETHTLVIPTPPGESVSAEEVEQRLAAMMFPPFGFI